jgi:hypothetical protein
MPLSCNPASVERRSSARSRAFSDRLRRPSTLPMGNKKPCTTLSSTGTKSYFTRPEGLEPPTF